MHRTLGPRGLSHVLRGSRRPRLPHGRSGGAHPRGIRRARWSCGWRTPSSQGVSGERGSRAPAFPLAPVGGLAALRFAERLSALDLTPAHAGVGRMIALDPGIQQRALGARLGIGASRLVAFIDQLEQKGLVERRNDPEDRRTHNLHLTDASVQTLQAIGRVAREHQDDLCRAPDHDERSQLAQPPQRLAQDHGLRTRCCVPISPQRATSTSPMAADGYWTWLRDASAAAYSG